MVLACLELWFCSGTSGAQKSILDPNEGFSGEGCVFVYLAISIPRLFEAFLGQVIRERNGVNELTFFFFFFPIKCINVFVTQVRWKMISELCGAGKKKGR